VSANLDLDDVVAGHPVARQELIDLRARLEKAEKDLRYYKAVYKDACDSLDEQGY